MVCVRTPPDSEPCPAGTRPEESRRRRGAEPSVGEEDPGRGRPGPWSGLLTSCGGRRAERSRAGPATRAAAIWKFCIKAIVPAPSYGCREKAGHWSAARRIEEHGEIAYWLQRGDPHGEIRHVIYSALSDTREFKKERIELRVAPSTKELIQAAPWRGLGVDSGCSRYEGARPEFSTTTSGMVLAGGPGGLLKPCWIRRATREAGGPALRATRAVWAGNRFERSRSSRSAEPGSGEIHLRPGPL